MLVISRKKDDVVVLFDRDSMLLIGFVLVLDIRGRVSLGVDLDPMIGLVRLELTGWTGLPFSELRKIPKGTPVPSRGVDHAGGV